MNEIRVIILFGPSLQMLHCGKMSEIGSGSSMMACVSSSGACGRSSLMTGAEFQVNSVLPVVTAGIQAAKSLARFCSIGIFTSTFRGVEHDGKCERYVCRVGNRKLRRGPFGLPTVTRQGRDPLGLGRAGHWPER